jgi:hypothetical protein
MIGPDDPVSGIEEEEMTRLSRLLACAATAIGFGLPLSVLHAQDAAQAPQPPADKPLASVPGDTPGLHVDVLSLKRTEGGMLTLRVAYVNETGAPVKTQSFPGSGDPLGGSIVLVDYGTKRKYGVITFSDGSCLCTTNLGYNNNFEPGSKLGWAKFTAPPESVKKITVLFTGAGEPVEDIPITR